MGQANEAMLLKMLLLERCNSFLFSCTDGDISHGMIGMPAGARARCRTGTTPPSHTQQRQQQQHPHPGKSSTTTHGSKQQQQHNTKTTENSSSSSRRPMMRRGAHPNNNKTMICDMRPFFDPSKFCHRETTAHRPQKVQHLSDDANLERIFGSEKQGACVM